MKLFYFLVSIISILSCKAQGQNKTGKVSVYGVVNNYRNVIEIVDKDYTEPFQVASSERSFVPDNQGRFSVEFILNEPKYFRLARNIIYLCPGDKLETNIDYLDPKNASFKGNHSQENEYLKFIPYPKAGSFLEGGQNIKSTIEETFQAMLDSAKERRKRLSIYKNLSSDFRFLEQNRIDADLLNSFYSVRSYFPLVHKLSGDDLTAFNNNFPAIVNSYVKKYVPFVLDAHLMKLEVYRDVVPRILKQKDSTGKEAAKIYDWFFAKEVMHNMQTDTLGFEVQKIRQIKTVKYRDAVFEAYQKLLSLNGSKAADIALIDTKGNRVSLSSLKGKIIYIDVWATWCAPCIKEQPYLDSLVKRFKDDPDVVFLSLSIDRDIKAWTDYVEKKHPEAQQFITDLSNLSPYSVSEIPRTILIDKNFDIFAMRGPMPSSSEIISIIQKMKVRFQ